MQAILENVIEEWRARNSDMRLVVRGWIDRTGVDGAMRRWAGLSTVDKMSVIVDAKRELESTEPVVARLPVWLRADNFVSDAVATQPEALVHLISDLAQGDENTNDSAAAHRAVIATYLPPALIDASVHEALDVSRSFLLLSLCVRLFEFLLLSTPARQAPPPIGTTAPDPDLAAAAAEDLRFVAAKTSATAQSHEDDLLLSSADVAADTRSWLRAQFEDDPVLYWTLRGLWLSVVLMVAVMCALVWRGESGFEEVADL